MQSGFFSLLKNRNFLLLWGEQILSQFAYNLVNFALLVWVFNISNSSFAVSLLILSFILPTAIFGVFTGVIADQLDRRKIMLFIHAVWAVFVILFIFVKDNLILILVFSFLLNTIDRFFTPAEQASLPNVVSKDDLLLANSLFSFSLNAGFLLGFSAAGPLMLVFSNDLPFFLASFLVGSGLIFVWLLPPLLPSKEKEERWHRKIVKETISEIKKGYYFVRSTKIIYLAIILFSLLQIGMNTAMALSPSYVVNILGFEDPKHASWAVMFPVGLGSVAAIILLKFWQHDLKRKLISRGILIAGIALLGLGVSPLAGWVMQKASLPFSYLLVVYPLVFISAGCLGLSVALILVPALTIISQYTPNDYLGRVWGVANLIQNTVAILPLLIFGALADRISVLPLVFMFAFFSIFLYTAIYNAKLRIFFRKRQIFLGMDMLFPIKK